MSDTALSETTTNDQPTKKTRMHEILKFYILSAFCRLSVPFSVPYLNLAPFFFLLSRAQNVRRYFFSFTFRGVPAVECVRHTDVCGRRPVREWNWHINVNFMLWILKWSRYFRAYGGGWAVFASFTSATDEIRLEYANFGKVWAFNGFRETLASVI